MSFDNRTRTLHERRRDLKERIAAETARPHPDDLALRRMKAEKCRLKDEIAAIERQSSAASAA